MVGVVDDDVSIRRALGRLLRSMGHPVETYASSEEFITSAHRDDTGCLLIDVHLPGMSGFDLQCHLTACGLSIPIIFITAHDDLEARGRALRAGAVAYLEKPFSVQFLAEVLQLALAKSKEETASGV